MKMSPKSCKKYPKKQHRAHGSRAGTGREQTEAALPCAKNATDAALISNLNSLRSLGIVWIPGFAAEAVREHAYSPRYLR